MIRAMRRAQSLSIVVPVYRGELFLERLVAEIDDLRDVLLEADSPITLDRATFVDDGAVDGSAALLEHLAGRHPWIGILHLPQNSGQHAATAAGIGRSAGDWIATLDEDLQHRPHNLLALLSAATSASADIAYAAPLGAVHRTFYRDVTSRTAKRWISLLSGNPNVRHFNSFRVVRGEVARATAAIFQGDTYLDIAFSWFTDRVLAVPVSLVDRRDLAGQASGYGLLSLARHAQRMIVCAWSGPPNRESNGGSASSLSRRSESISRALAIDRSGDAELCTFLETLPRPAGKSAAGTC